MRDVSDGKSERDDGLDKKGNRRDFKEDFCISSLEKQVGIMGLIVSPPKICCSLNC